MKNGYVYESSGYIVLDHTRYQVKTLMLPPIQYPILLQEGLVRHECDYPLWAPSPVYGMDSPWGKGSPTVNLDYLFGK